MTNAEVSVAGAAAVWDYIYPVERLPEPGQFDFISEDCPTPYPGGCAPNIACALARLGHQVELYYPVGGDFAHSHCEKEWLESGIDLSHLRIFPNKRSGYALMFIEPGGRSFGLGFPGASATDQAISAAELADNVVIGPVLNPYTESLLELAAARRKRLIVSGIGHPHLLKRLKDIHALIINENEAHQLFQVRGSESLIGISQQLPGVRFYITRGQQGSALYLDGKTFDIPLIHADRIEDPTGAGDAYSAGVIAGILRDLSPVMAGCLGAAVSSFVIERYGAQTHLPDWDTALKRLREQAKDIFISIMGAKDNE